MQEKCSMCTFILCSLSGQKSANYFSYTLLEETYSVKFAKALGCLGPREKRTNYIKIENSKKTIC